MANPELGVPKKTEAQFYYTLGWFYIPANLRATQGELANKSVYQVITVPERVATMLAALDIKIRKAYDTLEKEFPQIGFNPETQKRYDARVAELGLGENSEKRAVILRGYKLTDYRYFIGDSNRYGIGSILSKGAVKTDSILNINSRGPIVDAINNLGQLLYFAPPSRNAGLVKQTR